MEAITEDIEATMEGTAAKMDDGGSMTGDHSLDQLSPHITSPPTEHTAPVPNNSYLKNNDHTHNLPPSRESLVSGGEDSADEPEFEKDSNNQSPEHSGGETLAAETPTLTIS